MTVMIVRLFYISFNHISLGDTDTDNILLNE